MAVFGLQESNKNDEVTNFQMARYISSNEAVWRLLKFPLHERYPAVIHPGEAGYSLLVIIIILIIIISKTPLILRSMVCVSSR